MEFKNILLTTDLSDNSAAATPYAVELARQFGGRIHLVHVFEDVTLLATTSEDAFAAATASQTGWMTLARQQRELALRSLAETMATSEKLEVTPVFRQGPAATEIVDAAKKSGADCIIIATHGRTGLSHLLFGSVAERVVRLSECPVLTVRPKKA
jgi:universal stress protein A